MSSLEIQERSSIIKKNFKGYVGPIPHDGAHTLQTPHSAVLCILVDHKTARFISKYFIQVCLITISNK